jgi:hypothetical protein
MNGKGLFIKKDVIINKIDEPDLNSFVVDFDLNDNGEYEYMLDALVKSIIKVLPEYVYAYHEPAPTAINSVEYISNAAKSMFKAESMLFQKNKEDKKEKVYYYELLYKALVVQDNSALQELQKLKLLPIVAGDFGELILHLLLREFKNTLPLISKVYFKDSRNVPAHGFDAVHITEIDTQTRYLWLGESKFNKDPRKVGIPALIKDLTEHFNRDFLEQQITVIKKNIQTQELTNNPQRDEWINKLNTCSKIKDIVSVVNVPLLCTYECDSYVNHSGNWNDEDMNLKHFNSVRSLKKYFDKRNQHSFKDKLNIILFLFPIRNKNELLKKLLEKLWHMQQLG